MAVPSVQSPRKRSVDEKPNRKPFPQSVTLNELFESLPKEVFTQDHFKAYGSLLATIGFITLSILLTSKLPWYLLPIGWILLGVSVTGLLAIGQDCTHLSFGRSKLVNDIVGTIAMLPLGYPFQSYKTRQRYQATTEKVPQVPETPVTSFLYDRAVGYTFWLRSIAHWASQHFDINLFRTEDQVKVRIGIFGVFTFGAVFFPIMWWYVGLQGIVNYWLLPWLVYHFIISTTNMLPHIVSLDEQHEHVVVHCNYPQWLEYITHDIGIHFPRTISTSIPHYNLRKAYTALKQQWGDYIHEYTVDWYIFDDLLNKSHEINSRNFSPFANTPCVPPHKAAFDKEGNLNYVSQPTGFSVVWEQFQYYIKIINWLHFVILIPTPIIAVYGLMTVTPHPATIVFAFVYYFITGVAITAGYHRLWAHKAYSVKTPLKVGLVLLGAGAVQGSIRWWCRDHRAHHRYTDSDKDPYSAGKGFIYSHIGWMLLKQNPEQIGKAGIEDLNQDPWIRWQHKYYLPIAIATGIVLPSVIPALWGDLMGGYFYAGVLRLVGVHHATFFVNSLAHYWGEITYADHHTPRDSIITAVLTFGEGYHNFHHEFPHDYRNAVFFWQWDPTKWFIAFMALIGQAYDLKTFSDNEIKKGRVQITQKKLNKRKQDIYWGSPVSELPMYTKESLAQEVSEGKKLVIIEGFVHDVERFMDDHPGGKVLLESAVGKDLTPSFNGAVYEHSNAARNLLSTMRVGRVSMEEFPFKKSHLSVSQDKVNPPWVVAVASNGNLKED